MQRNHSKILNKQLWENVRLSHSDYASKDRAMNKVNKLLNKLETTASECYSGSNVIKVEVKNCEIKNDFEHDLVAVLDVF